MGARSRRRGYRTEAAVVAWLRAHGWTHAERRAGNPGSDIVGVLPWSIEIKGHADPMISMRKGIPQAARQAERDAAYPLTIIRIPGTTNVAHWWTAWPASDHLDREWPKPAICQRRYEAIRSTLDTNDCVSVADKAYTRIIVATVAIWCDWAIEHDERRPDLGPTPTLPGEPQLDRG